MATTRRKRKTTARRAKKRRKPATKAKKRTGRRLKARSRKPKRRIARKAKPRRVRAKGRRPAAKRAGRPRTTAPRRMAAAEVEVAPVSDVLAARVEAVLRGRGYDPPDATVVEVLTAIGTGYRQGPASPPAWLHVDVDGPIADGVVERFAAGDRANDIDRSMHRGIVRSAVDTNLDQLPGGASTGDAERSTLTSFCLGSWDPAMDANAERNGIASFVVPWYLAGRS